MATLRDYFLTDKNHEMKVTQTTEITTPNGLRIPVQMFLDFASGSIYLAYYLEPVSDPLQLCINLVTGNAVTAVLGVTGGFEIADGYPEINPIKAADLKFCGHVYFYSDNALSDGDFAKLLQVAKQKGLQVQYYSPDWAAQRAQLEQPMAFISHDSRDKDSIAKPLVAELLRFPGCTVWYDEYSLKVGDNLRESIEKGLKECKKCVLVLTKNFLMNKSWTKTEFNSIFTRELIEQANVVLPIWCNVSREDIYSYSPSLANKVAVQWGKGATEVARLIYLAANA
ncbi:MAG: toll/interleukin-1 receptor domain-containing protein [Anaerolineales bacterium]|nr:toll/interleukin-1 receptor domain-containing protein [Anaerolineales bacterium]